MINDNPHSIHHHNHQHHHHQDHDDHQVECLQLCPPQRFTGHEPQCKKLRERGNCTNKQVLDQTKKQTNMCWNKHTNYFMIDHIFMMNDIFRETSPDQNDH